MAEMAMKAPLSQSPGPLCCEEAGHMRVGRKAGGVGAGGRPAPSDTVHHTSRPAGVQLGVSSLGAATGHPAVLRGGVCMVLFGFTPPFTSTQTCWHKLSASTGSCCKAFSPPLRAHHQQKGLSFPLNESLMPYM